MAVISLENMEFFSYHGCFSEEQLIGTKFAVDLWLEVDTSRAEITDDLKETVNYAEVYQVVKQQMDVHSKLIENVANRIMNAVHISFPAIREARVKIHKLNPPVGGKLGSVSFELSSVFTG